MSAASAARRIDPTLEIVVLERGGYAAYGMCGLPYYVSGLVERAEQLLAYPPAYFREERRIDLRLHATVTALDADRHVVHFSHDGGEHRLHYHAVVVAAGGAPVVPPLPGVDDERVFAVRTLEDAVTLRSLLDAGRIGRAIVVGAGYIGLEMVEALHDRGVTVVVAEVLPRVMPNLDEPVAALVEHEVRRHGVDLRLGARLEGIRSGMVDLDALIDGDTVSADAVIMAVGVRAAANVAAVAGATTGPGGALLVDDRMRTSLPDVYAAGDCIAPWHLVLGRPAFVPLGPAANRDGSGGRNGCGRGRRSLPGDRRHRGGEGLRPGGRPDRAHPGRGGVRGVVRSRDRRGRPFARQVLPGHRPRERPPRARGRGRLLGAQMVGGDGVAKRIDVVAAALQAGFDIDDLGALDLSYAPPYAPVYEPLLLAAQAAAGTARPVLAEV